MDVQDMEKKIMQFFSTKIGINLFSKYLFTKMNSNIVLLYPLSTNVITIDNIKEIQHFFSTELKMNTDSELHQEKRNKVITIEFYYDISYRVTLFITYFNFEKKNFYFLNFIEIHKDGNKIHEIMGEKAKRDMEEIRKLMKK